MKLHALRLLTLALLAATIALAGCAGTHENAQQSDAAQAKGATMETPF